MATVIKCDICGAEGARKNVRTLMKFLSIDSDGNTHISYRDAFIDLCEDCMSKVTNLCISPGPNVSLEPTKETFYLSESLTNTYNEGYINIYEADGKEELRTSCRVYKTLDRALKEKEAHCDDEYYLKTIKIKW